MKNNLTIKDIVRISLFTAIYFLIYFGVMMAIWLAGPFAHAISPGVQGFFGGTVLYFMSRKIGKMWQFTILSGIIMALFTMMGGGYLIWIVATMITAVIADFMVSRKSNPPVFLLAIASGLMHVGQALGAIIPSTFFLEQYKADWIARGQAPEMMEEYVKYTSGLMGIFSTLVTFVLAFAGIYIAHAILKKHFKNN